MNVRVTFAVAAASGIVAMAFAQPGQLSKSPRQAKQPTPVVYDDPNLAAAMEVIPTLIQNHAGNNPQVREVVMQDDSQQATEGAVVQVTSTSVAFDQTGVPCFSFTGGCGAVGPGNGIALPFPRYDVSRNDSVEYNVLFQSTVNAPINVVFILLINGAPAAFDVFSTNAQQDTVVAVTFPNQTIPNQAGAGVVVGAILDPNNNIVSFSTHNCEVN